MKRILLRIYDRLLNPAAAVGILLAANAIPLLLLAWGIKTGNAAAVIASVPLMAIFTALVFLAILGAM